MVNITELELADRRRDVDTLYASVRAERNPERGYAVWRAGCDELFRRNSAYHPSCRYDAAWQCPLAPAENTIKTEILGDELIQRRTQNAAAPVGVSPFRDAALRPACP